MRSSRDGFTEKIVEKTALTRRRVKDKRLRNEIMTVGKRSKTDISVSYIDTIANEETLKIIKEKIKKIDIDGLVMADKALEEFLVEFKWNLYPLLRNTQRLLIAADHLYSEYIDLI